MALLPPAPLEELRRAREILENPSLAARLGDLLGVPIDAALKRLPAGAQKVVHGATRAALERSLDLALTTLDRRLEARTADWLHRGIVIASGAAGGATGLAGLAVELPFSLTVMLRSIADHARAQGEDLAQLGARLECLTVFAYGSRADAPDPGGSAYFAVRASLSRSVASAAEFVAERGLAEALGDRGARPLAQLVARVAHRLGIAVADKAAAQLVPLLGAAGGAAINALYIDHYQDTAWAHFTVRRLERAHGPDAVRAAYDGAR
jgi:EcsC family protein